MLRTISLAVSAVALSATFASADVTGTWRSETNAEGGWVAFKIAPCGDAMCAKITGSSNKSNVGKTMIKGMKASGKDSYSGGQVWAPDTDKWYKGKMSLTSSNKLSMAGCVLGGVICRSADFTRQ